MKYNEELYDVIVVGLGAAGLFALANIDKNKNALGIEAKHKVGLKLGITGGGRCNITNVKNLKNYADNYTHPSFVRPIINAFNPDKTMEYFESRGFNLIKEGYRVLPKTENAKDVIRFFLNQIENKGHKIHLEEEIIDFKAEDDYVVVNSKVSSYKCKKLIISTGGATYNNTGSNGKLVKDCFDISPYKPALSSMHINENYFESLHGVSLNVKIKYNKKVFEDNLLFAKTMLTGYSVMNLSNYIELGESFIIDFAPQIDREEFKTKIKDAVKTAPKKLFKTVCLDVLSLPESFVRVLIDMLELDTVKLADLKSKDLNKFVELLKNMELSVKSKLPLEKAICSLGGVKISDIDNKTMALKSDNRICVIGEALEPVGACGGYNLQFAWSSAFVCIFEH